MIRKLLASTAMLALMTAGSFSIAQAQDEPAQTQEPAAIEQEQAAPAEVAESEETLVPEEPTLATAFMGQSVYSSEDPESDNIGDVSDLIIGEDGSITHAVVGVGGFLGIGEKQVAVPFDELQVVEQDGEIRLVYAATKEQLEAAEAFDRTAYDPGARFAEEQAAMQPDPAADPAAGLAPAPATDPAADPLAQPAETEMAAEEPAAEDPAPEETATADTVTTEEESEAAGKNEAFAGDPAAEQDPADGEMTAEAPAEGEEMAAAEVDADATAEQDTAAADAEAPAEEEVAAADTEADATAEGDIAATEAPAEEEVAEADAEATASGDVETFVSFNADQIRASTLMGKEIFGAEDESIGEVSDLVLQEDGETRAAIIDVGGFLGVGEKAVAIPFDQIEVQQEEGGEPRLMVAMTREELEQAPAFEGGTMEDMAATDTIAEPADTAAEPAPEQDLAADPAAEPEVETDVAAETVEPAEGEEPLPEGVVAEDITAEGGFDVATQDLSAEDLIGTAVQGANEENIGEVGDVIFAQSGEIEAVVVDVGGFLGIGEKPVAIQFDALNVQKGTNGDVQLMIDASQEQLESAPSYEAEQAAVQ